MGSCFLAQVEMPCFAQEPHQYPLGMEIQDDHGKIKGQHFRLLWQQSCLLFQVILHTSSISVSIFWSSEHIFTDLKIQDSFISLSSLLIQCISKCIQNAVCLYICKIVIKYNLKLSLKNQTFKGNTFAICPSLFFTKGKIVPPLLQFRYRLKYLSWEVFKKKPWQYGNFIMELEAT